MKYEIVNALVLKRKLIYHKEHKNVTLKLTLQSTCGLYEVEHHLYDLARLFEILRCNEYKDMVGKSCVLLLEDGKYKDIGDVLFVTNTSCFAKPDTYWLDYCKAGVYEAVNGEEYNGF